MLPLAAAGVIACRKGPAASTPDVLATARPNLPADPLDRAWDALPVHTAPLLLQDMVEPRLLKPSTAEVRVRAVTDGARIAFRLEWDDSTASDRPGPGMFTDACAVQLPTTPGPDVPAPQMGESGRGVEITYWRASWQATVDGRGDTLKDLYPNASVDHYPFDAASLKKDSQAQREMQARYAPARALGNAMAGPRERPVEDLLAEGPGSLTAGPSTGSDGRGRRTRAGWAVVLSRRVPAGFGSGGRGQVAFAVWEGGHEEAGARKMRTGWIPLVMEAAS